MTDPINGLINYANEIKPYHSKVIEVLTEYVHDEDIKVAITESLITNFGIVISSRANVTNASLLNSLNGTFGQGGYGTSDGWPVVSINQSLEDGAFDTTHPSYNVSNNSVSIPDNQTAVYRAGRTIEVDLYAIDITTGERTTGVQTEYVIASSTYVPTGQILGILNNPVTLLKMTTDLEDTSAIPPLGDDEEYAAIVQIKPVDIHSIITGYGNTKQIAYTSVPPGGAPLPYPEDTTVGSEPNESIEDGTYTNSILLFEDVAKEYPFGAKLVALLENEQTREFTVAATYYNASTDKTIIRVNETIDPDDDYANSKVIEKFYGIDEAYANANSTTSDQAEGLVQTSLSESISFSWGEVGTDDVIDGAQYVIREVINTDTFTVNGDVSKYFKNGDVVNAINSESNDGNHTIVDIEVIGQTSNITVSSTLIDSIGGGWLEST